MSSRAEQKAAARAAREAAERADAQAEGRRRRLVVFGSLVALAAVIVLGAILVSRSSTENAPPAADRLAMFDGIPEQGPWLGRPGAPAVVEEFVDLQCPFCAQFATGELPGIVRDYVRPGRARLRLRVVSILGPESVRAAQVAGAARLQNRGWQFTEAVFGKQGQENSGYMTDAFLRARAKEAGLDVERAMRDRNDPRVRNALVEDMRVFQAARLGGTPGFRVGKRGGSLQSVEVTALRQAIDAAAATS
jgi:protein-disulfide isomerase